MNYNFKKKNINTTYRSLIPESKPSPRIIFSKKSIMWIRALIDNHDYEVGFYATVEKYQNEDTFYINNVYYPKHSEANTGTCSISSEGETDLINFLIENNKMDEIKKMRLWGHKHMSGTGPTAQDEQMAFHRIKSTNSYLIRVICDDKEMNISFFDLEKNIRFDNVHWEVEKKNEYDDIKKINLIKELVNEFDNNCVSKDGISYSKIIDEIYKIISDDFDYNKIVEKVLQLKEINMKNINNIDSHLVKRLNNEFDMHNNFTQESLFDQMDTSVYNSDIINRNFDNNNYKKKIDKLTSKIETVDGKDKVVFYRNEKKINNEQYKKILVDFKNEEEFQPNDNL